MLSERLREARKRKNYSQEYVAEKVHTSRQTVPRWENGTSEPSIETLKKLAELYDVSINYLLEISENQSSPAPVEAPDKAIHPAEKKKEYQYEIFFFLIITIISSFIYPLGIIVSLSALIWSRNKKVPTLFYIVITVCLILDIINCAIVINGMFFHIGDTTTITPIE